MSPVRVLPPHTPVTDGRMFDVLHGMYGIGTWDEDTPWWKFRARESAKIKASRRKHNRSLAELYVAALYCRAHAIDVRAVTFLYRHIGDAWAWWESKQYRVAVTPHDRYAAAVRDEMANPDDAWLNRLLRADPSVRDEVYQQWLHR